MRTTAILASHNRREKTLRCLRSYFDQEVEPGMVLEAVLLDDASSDGTAEAVRDRFPAVQVLGGTGDLYWAGGMALAERAALVTNPDFLLWLNDDVVLDQGALRRLLDTAGPDAMHIAVGALRDPVTAEITYAGFRRRGRHPLRMDLVRPLEAPVPVDAFHGNVVLVPRPAALGVGPIDGALGHDAADLDYGLRARQAGIASLLAPDTLGTCARDHPRASWQHRPLKERIRLLLGPKGAPPGARARFLRRHGGPLWPFFWLVLYVRAVPRLMR